MEIRAKDEKKYPAQVVITETTVRVAMPVDVVTACVNGVGYKNTVYRSRDFGMSAAGIWVRVETRK